MSSTIHSICLVTIMVTMAIILKSEVQGEPDFPFADADEPESPAAAGPSNGNGKDTMPDIPFMKGGGCAAQKSATIDEDWLFQAKKWYIVYSDEFSKETLTNAAIPDIKPPAKGSKKLCWKSSFKLSGGMGNMPGLPVSYSCTYKNNVAKQKCNVKSLEQTPAGGLGKFLFGLLPTAIEMTIVMTDNSNYFAVATCVSNVLHQFTVLSVTPAGPGEAVMKEIKKKYKGIGVRIAEEQINKAGNKKKVSGPGFSKETAIIDRCEGDKGHGKGDKSNLEKGAAALKKMDKLGLAERLSGKRSGSRSAAPPDAIEE